MKTFTISSCVPFHEKILTATYLWNDIYSAPCCQFLLVESHLRSCPCPVSCRRKENVIVNKGHPIFSGLLQKKKKKKISYTFFSSFYQMHAFLKNLYLRCKISTHILFVLFPNCYDWRVFFITGLLFYCIQNVCLQCNFRGKLCLKQIYMYLKT